jgi:iron complex outermembrane receptor protein
MNRGRSNRAVASTALSIVSAVLGLPAWGQSADQPDINAGLQEIVVTATRRAERLQDVPVSVTALSQEQMDAQGLRNIDDVTRLTPGVTFQRMGMSISANYNDENSDINIRGIDSQAGASTTGVYIDDTPIQTRHIGFGSVNPYPALFDLERVEVLRGPQGTLFGAGAEGGAVRFISPEPGLERSSAYARSELSTTERGDPSYELAAAGGAPLIDGVLGFRVSASLRRDGGWVDRVAYSHPEADPLTPPAFTGNVEPNSNWQRTTTLRAALKWAAADSLSVTPSFYYQKLHINDTAAYWINLSDPASGVYRNGNALTNPSTDPFWLAAIKVEWHLGGADLTSNTSYFSRHQHSVSDYTQFWRATFLGNTYPQPGDVDYAPFADTQNNFYQEVRLASVDAAARFSWNTGVFFSHLNENVAENIVDPTLDAEFAALTGGFPLCGANGLLGQPCPNGTLLLNPVNRTVDRQLAVFGEVSLKLTDTLKATLGVRVAKMDVTGTTLNTGGALALDPGVESRSSQSEKPVTPKAVLSWQPTRDNLFYASASKGYRVGGVNGEVSAICAGDLAAIGIPASADGVHHVPPQYSSDSLWSYELGAKNTLLERRLQVNTSLFLIDWTKIQQNVYLPDCGQQYVANLGQVRSVGGDLDIQYRPIDSLSLGLAVAYVDAKFTRTSCANGLVYNGAGCVGTAAGAALSAAPIVTEGDRLVGAPWTVLVSSEFTHGLWNGHTGYVRLDYQLTTAQTDPLAFQDSRNALFDNTVPGLPETKNLSLRAGLRWNGIDLSVFGQNLTNEHPLLFASRDIPPITPASPPDNLYYGRTMRPRTIGVTATYRY